MVLYPAFDVTSMAKAIQDERLVLSKKMDGNIGIMRCGKLITVQYW